MSRTPYLTCILLLLIFCSQAQSRLISHCSSLSYDLVSDGVHDLRDPTYLRLNRNSFSAAEATCEQTYGFMPCTKTIIGNMFLIMVYGYLMFLAATYLSSGSELLLEILGPGIIGGLFLPVLGALPDAMLILGTTLVFILFLRFVYL